MGAFERLGPVRGVVVAAALVAALLALPKAQGARAVSLSLEVAFSANDTIAVTLPDGATVGSTAGAPTVIPAGFYTIELTGPLNPPTGLPYFQLTGPGVNVLSNLNEGGISFDTATVTFLPSSSYGWTDDAISGVTHTFVTSSDVLGTAPGVAVSPHSGKPAASQDLVGSDVVPFRGVLSGTVSAAGKVSVSFGGKRAAALRPGRYRVAISDSSSAVGFSLTKTGHRAKPLTTIRYRGRRTVSIDLTAGRWLVAAPAGAKSDVIVVS
ncbi:MAG TPA: hypothetical protein VG265_04345 [Gaiellaceae bacterium]|nr:hypothetical protein [Gaiellaceae bacterium]